MNSIIKIDLKKVISTSIHQAPLFDRGGLARQLEAYYMLSHTFAKTYRKVLMLDNVPFTRKDFNGGTPGELYVYKMYRDENQDHNTDGIVYDLKRRRYKINVTDIRLANGFLWYTLQSRGAVVNTPIHICLPLKASSKMRRLTKLTLLSKQLAFPAIPFKGRYIGRDLLQIISLELLKSTYLRPAMWEWS